MAADEPAVCQADQSGLGQPVQRLIRFFSGTAALVLLSSCRTGPGEAFPGKGPLRSEASFPPITLADQEFVQSFKVKVQGGRITALRRIPEDWDLHLEWEEGGCEILSGRAGHFSSGLASVECLDRFLTVEAVPDPGAPGSVGSCQLRAVLVTGRTDLAGGGGRKLAFGQMLLSPPWPARDNDSPRFAHPFQLNGSVTDAKTGRAVGEFFVTPRFAFPGNGSARFGEWDEFLGQTCTNGLFKVSYDRPLRVGFRERHAWQFRIEASGYEPFLTPVIRDQEPRPTLDCALIPLPDK